MSSSVIYVRRKSDGRVFRDVVNDACQVHNIFDGDEPVVCDKDFNIGYSEGFGFQDWADFDVVGGWLSVSKVLVFYDVPQLFTATDRSGFPYICTVYDIDGEGCLLATGALVSEEEMRSFLEGGEELLGLMRSAESEGRMFDIEVGPDGTWAEVRTEPLEEYMLPSEGYFYREGESCSDE